MTPNLFGTDGVRGVAGRHPLDHETVRRLGAALIRALPRGAEAPRVLVGRDTRESGDWIEAELAHGASGEGAQVTSAGVVPTPAVAYLTRSAAFDLGVVISASHNPFEDNGIKVFSGKGEKFTEAIEREVEAIVADRSWSARPGSAGAVPGADLVGAYLDHLARHPAGPGRARAVQARRRLRERRHKRRRPQAPVRPRLRNRRHRRISQTAATSTCTAVPRIRRRCSRWCCKSSARWASRLTATAIARSSSTSAATS